MKKVIKIIKIIPLLIIAILFIRGLFKETYDGEYIKEIEVKGYKVVVFQFEIRIVDSYKITKEHEMRSLLNELTQYTNRSIDSMVREWRVHNRLYKLGIAKESTKDVNFNVNEGISKTIVYDVLGAI